jgi:hypothetical protein
VKYNKGKASAKFFLNQFCKVIGAEIGVKAQKSA